MTQGINLWHTTAADNASAGTINWAEGMNPGSVNDSARQTMSDLRTWYEDYEWRDFGHTPTFATSSSFTISSAASLSPTYCVNRRLRIVDSVSGTAYGTISATTWVGNTQTVTLSPLSTALNTTTSVALGNTPTNSSIPASSLDGLTAFAVAQATLTTPGDMLYASATATAARLAVGATTAILAGGTLPTWTAVPTLAGANVGNIGTSVTTAGAVYSQYGFYENANKVSRGFTWLETQNPSLATSVLFATTLQVQKRYRLVGRITVSASDSAAVRFNSDSGANYGVVVNTTDSVAPGNTAASSSGSTQILVNTAYAGGDLINFDIEFETQQGNDHDVIVTFNSSTIRATRAAFNRSAGSGFWAGAGNLTSVTIFNYNAAGTFTGTLRLGVYEQ